ncbi:uncharacterized protein LOC114361804 [Ostrinia furnacalis]|uniref:uncharacterized protein LOC114361804 n=1 Tax=Ostrinia furnacalis TaxID=93504 RepID=UPI00103E17AD|nr:uncharacterized protein LOC114361804 [Ostrinia furnacalis]
MSKQCYSEIECKIIKAQIERRAKYRKEFLKARTDPCKHSQEAGYVFDEAMQRFMTLKCYQTYYFQPCMQAAIKGILCIAPMFIYGYIIWESRNKFETACRCGSLRYRDRLFKLQ